METEKMNRTLIMFLLLIITSCKEKKPTPNFSSEQTVISNDIKNVCYVSSKLSQLYDIDKTLSPSKTLQTNYIFINSNNSGRNTLAFGEKIKIISKNFSQTKMKAIRSKQLFSFKMNKTSFVFNRLLSTTLKCHSCSSIHAQENKTKLIENKPGVLSLYINNKYSGLNFIQRNTSDCYSFFKNIPQKETHLLNAYKDYIFQRLKLADVEAIQLQDQQNFDQGIFSSTFETEYFNSFANSELIDNMYHNGIVIRTNTAKQQGEIIGNLLYKNPKQGYGNTLKIVSISIVPEYRRQGLAIEMLNHLLDEARKTDHISFLELKVSHFNQKAIDCYLKFGFFIKSEMKNYYLDGDNAYIMQLKIK